MLTFEVPENDDFIGRETEKAKFIEISSRRSANIIVVHGRRRVGKTELIEQHFRSRNLLKFEGIEPGTNDSREEIAAKQREAFAAQLMRYVGFSEEVFAARRSWTELFLKLHEVTKKGAWTIYFDELQWMAGFADDLVAELKYVWDNYLRRNPELLLVLCGSSPSFMKNNVVRSKALHSRSMYEMRVDPFTLQETALYLGAGRQDRSVLDCYLSVGGIPEYLQYFREDKSVLLPLCQESFLPGGYFTSEYDRIFVSSLGSQNIYKEIVNYLASKKYASREELSKGVGLTKGGTLSKHLLELEDVGLIERYSPYNASTRSKLVRYCLSDYYLHFYAAFILPELAAIASKKYANDPVQALPTTAYRQWLGYGFERFCRINNHKIADILRFSGIKYNAGSYFKRAHINGDTGYQIDLLFDRSDSVITVCEMKYKASQIGVEVINEVEDKIEKLETSKEIQRVLIAPNGVRDSLRERAYFDKILGIEDIMSF